MTQQTKPAFDLTLVIGLVFVMAFILPSGMMLFDPTYCCPNDVKHNELAVLFGLVGFVLMIFLFFRTAVRVMYHE